MKNQSIVGAVLVLGLLACLGGCAKKEEIGPAQKAGAAIDDVGDKVADKLHEGLDKADAAAKAMADKAKAAQDEVAKATEDASKGVNKATDELGKKVEQAGEKIQDAARK